MTPSSTLVDGLRSVADVAATIRFAAERGVPVAARGTGHSPFGQGLVAGGVVVDMTSLGTVHEVTDQRLVVDAGARWRDVVAKPDDPVTTARMIELNQALHRRVRLAGGTVYPINALPMTSDDWLSHFGRAWDCLLTVKNRYDPDRILCPGQLRRCWR